MEMLKNGSRRGSSRTLIVALCWLGVGCAQRETSLLTLLEEAKKEFGEGRFPSFREEETVAASVTLDGTTLPSLTPPFPARVTFPVEVPELGFLDFSYAVVSARPVRRARVSFDVAAEVEGKQVRLYRDSVRHAGANRWHRGRVDLSVWAGRRIDLVLETQPAFDRKQLPWADRILAVWGNPVIRSRAAERLEDRWTRLGWQALSPPWLYAEAPAPRSVVFVVVDTLRADYIGAYGFEGEISPALDRLALESQLFEHAFTNAPWTKPAIATLFTGLEPVVHGVTDHERIVTGGTDALAAEVLTLGEALKGRGYETVGFVGNPWLASDYGFAQGFDTWEVHKKDAGVLRAARKWLSTHSTDKPFFLYVHFMGPHVPYDAPQWDYEAILDSPSLGPERLLSECEYRAIPGSVKRTVWATEEERYRRRSWRAKYGAGVREFDRTIEHFLRELRTSGILDEAYLVLTSDHGEELTEHGGWDHGFNLYEHQLRIPLLVRRPAAEQGGRRHDAFIGLVDVMPTLLALVGTESPKQIDGQDLSALVLGRSAKERTAVHASATMTRPRLHALRIGRHKLIVDLDLKTDQVRLFDLAEDPAEVENIAPHEPELVGRLFRQLLRHLDEASRRSLSPRYAPLPDSLREQLESLGYVK